ncbi:MAG TPA: tetratricopeptide repeat protein [Deferrisomatales bacterium]|nr:tetratricopeptide repeat protein [Deferrisomatales bacterium]
MRLGIDELLEGDRNLAKTQFESALEADPTNPAAGRLLGLIEANDPAVARAAVIQGIDLLNRGEPERAREELIGALCSDPDNALARELLGQLDADPRQVLGEASFAYTVQPGESLSRIAQRFLGDKYKFYLLARFNSLDNPSRLRSGQVIQVPGEAPSSVPAPTADTEPPRVFATPVGGVRQGPVSVALTAEDDRDPAPVVYFTLDGSPPRVGESSRYTGPLVLQKTTAVRFLAADRGGNVSPAGSETYVMESASAPAVPAVSVSDLYRQGLSAVERGDREAALALFDQVLEREPGHSGALETRQRVADEGVEDWYRQAYAALRRQRPRETVAYCDRVLALAPQHRNAQVLRMQAVDLINHLVEVDLSEARAALQRGQGAEVARHVGKVLELDPDNVAARELLRQSQPAR